MGRQEHIFKKSKSVKTDPAVVELKSQTSGNWRRTRMVFDVEAASEASLSTATDCTLALAKAIESKLRHVTIQFKHYIKNSFLFPIFKKS